MQKLKRPVSVILSILMVVSLFAVVPITASAAEETSTVTWNSFTTSGGMSSGGVTLTTTSGNYRVGNNFYKGRGSGTFKAPEGSVFTKIELKNCTVVDSLNFPGATVAQTGGYWQQEPWDDEPNWVQYYTVTWTGESSEVTFSGAIYGIQSIVFTLKSTAPDYVATVNGTGYDTLEAAFGAAVDGDTITLLADCAGNGIIVDQGKFGTDGLTVDFAGYTYTVDGEILAGSTGTKSQAFQLLKDNKVTFKNGTVYSEKAKMIIQNYSDLTLDGMTLTIDNPNYASAYTLSNNNGSATIKDTTINANPAGGFAFDVCRYASYRSIDVTVTGNSVINGDVEISASNNSALDGFSLTLTSGTMNGDIVVDASAASLIGEDNTVTKASTFTQEAPAGFEWVGEGSTQTLAAIPYVAQIGNNKYRTLEAAFAAAVDGDTITLLADCAGNGIIVDQGKFGTDGLTVDFAGYTYTVDGEILAGSTGTKSQAFQLLKDNKVTFKNGTVYSEKAKMIIQNYSDLTLDGMTLTIDNPNYASAYTLSNNNGSATIKDTTINANPAGGFAFDVCRYASYRSIDVTVTGNSVINGDVEISASNNSALDGFSLTLTSGTMNGDIVVDASAASLIGEDNTVTKASTFTQEAPAGFEWVGEGSTQTLAAIPYVAQIGNNKYRTLEAAFAAAVDGDTITLLADCAGNGIIVDQGKFGTDGLTVDFAGYTYTVDGEILAGSTGTKSQAFQLLKDNKVTFKNGTVYSEKAKMIIQNYSDLTLDGMTLTIDNPNYASAYTLSNNNGSATIKDTTINANPAGGFAFDVCRYASYRSIDVTVTGNSVINGDVEISASNNSALDGFSLTLTSGTMNGDIVVDASAASLIGEDNTVTKASTFTQEAPAGFEWVSNGDGTSSLAAIEYVAKIGDTKYRTLQDALDVVPTGGTVTVLQDITTSGNIFCDGYVSGGNRTYTVDLGGYTVSGGTFVVADGNAVTFTNGTIESATYGIQNTATAIVDETATVKSTSTGVSAVYGAAGSTTTINGTVEGDKYGVIVRGGTLNVAGTVTASDTNGTAIDAIDGGIANINNGADVSSKFAVVAHKNSTVNVNDGAEITGVSHALSGNGTAKDGPYTMNVTGGTLTATNGAGIYNPNAQGTLNISGGTITGNERAVVSGENATTAISGGTFNSPVLEEYCAPGFAPKDNGNGTYTVTKKLFVGHSVTLGGNIGVNFFLNPDIIGNNAAKTTVTFTWDGDKTASSGVTYDSAQGYYKASVEVVAAQMAHKIHAVVKINGTVQEETNDYSVQDYAEKVYKNPGAYDNKGKPDELKALAKAMLNYGSEAQTVFATSLTEHPDRADKNVGQTSYANVNAAAVKAKIQGTASNLETVAEQLNAKYYTNSLIYLQNNTLRVYFTPKTYPSTMPNAGEYDGNLSNYYYYTDVAGIAAAELDEQKVFKVGDVTFKYSALNYVVNVLESGDKMNDAQKDLAASLFLYNQAANAYF